MKQVFLFLGLHQEPAEKPGIALADGTNRNDAANCIISTKRRGKQATKKGRLHKQPTLS